MRNNLIEVITFHTKKAMDRRSEKMAKIGWTVKSVAPLVRGRSAIKTIMWGCLFLPLALFGHKKKQGWVVTFERAAAL